MRSFVYCLVGLVLVVGLLLSACAAPKAPVSAPSPAPQPAPGPAAQLSEWDTVLAAANKEATVTVYCMPGVVVGEVLKAGGKKYGIKVEIIGGSGGELELKIKTEQRAKAYVADLFIAGWTNTMNIVSGGQAQPVNAALLNLEEKDTWKVHPGKYDPTKTTHIFGTGFNLSLIINTDLVRKGEIQSWQDLLDPKWKDRMAMTDPRTGSGPGATAIWVWSTLGEDFWKKMAAQNITLHVRYELPVNQVAFGEKSMALFAAYPHPAITAIRAGAPVQIVHMKEGAPYFLNGITFIKNAPHPNAALVLLNWIFGREGQIAIGRVMESPALREDVVEDWLRIPELNPKAYTLLEPPVNLDPEVAKKGAAFATRIFGAR